MTKQFSLETETPIIRMPVWYSYAYEATICGIGPICGEIVLPYYDDGSHLDYGISRLLCKFKAWHPVEFVGVGYDEMRQNMAWVWRREEEVVA
jgi:hypothetical protein